MAINLQAEIALVNDNRDLLTSHSSLIQQNADNILLRVTAQEVDDTISSVLTSYAQISLLEDEIDLLVAKSSYTGTEIASRINLGTGGIKIQASKIALEGLTTINSNFKVLLDGSIEATNGKFSGRLTVPSSVSDYGVEIDQGTFEITENDGTKLLGINPMGYNIGGINYDGIAFSGHEVISFITKSVTCGIDMVDNGDMQFYVTNLYSNENKRVGGSLYPRYTGASGTYDLGSVSPDILRWRNIYLVNNPNVSSDIRYKENANIVRDDFESMVLNTEIITYNLKGDETKGKKIGINANKFFEMFGEQSEYIVAKNEEGYFGADYVNFVPMLIKTVQKLDKRIKDLEGEKHG